MIAFTTTTTIDLIMDTRWNDHSTGLFLLSRLLLHGCFSTTLDKEARFLGGFKYVTFS